MRLADKVETTVEYKIKKAQLVREYDVEAVKTIICIFKDFDMFNCAVFSTPVMRYLKLE